MKIPVVPGVGIIAVGVAKAGADIINITGYEGGTGAARAHSLRHVGLPAEIGLWLAHRALIESGLRQDVELWCDGGMKSGRDVIKMLCLGANRVGFGTLAMVAMGCTICRKCQEGTCHVGITTHIRTVEEAEAKGIKHFEPRDFEQRGRGDRQRLQHARRRHPPLDGEDWASPARRIWSVAPTCSTRSACATASTCARCSSSSRFRHEKTCRPASVACSRARATP